MNDEIKEILDYLQDKDNYIEELGIAYKRIYINNGDLNLLLNYITNLQQENERLKVKYNEEKSHQINYNYFETLYSKSTKEIVIDDLVWKCEELDNFKKEYEKSYIEKEDYKSRIEKVVEELKKIIYELEHNPRTNAETRDKYIIEKLNNLVGDTNVKD